MSDLKGGMRKMRKAARVPADISWEEFIRWNHPRLWRSYLDAVAKDGAKIAFESYFPIDPEEDQE